MRRALIALTAAFLLTACGSSGPNPADTYKSTAPKTVVADAYAAMQKLTSFRATGTRGLGIDSASFDLQSDKSGGITGTMTLHLTNKDGTSTDVKIDVIGVGGHVYIRGGSDFWGRALPSAGAVAKVANKWVVDVKPLSETITDLSLPGRILIAKNYAKEDAKVIGTGNVNGTPTVQVTLLSNNLPVTIDIAATDPHRILKIDAGANGAATFDQFDAPLDVKAPPAADIVDIAKLDLGK